MAVLPVLPVADIADAVTHYVDTLGFTEEFRMPDDKGGLVSAQVCLGDNHIMMNRNPADAGKAGGGIWLWLRVDDMDVDALYAKIKDCDGVTVVEDLGDRFWGDRSFAIKDGLGYTLAFNSKIA